MPGSFADTNVLLYMFVDRSWKAEAAERVFAGDLIVSVQVLNEAATVLRRKHRADWSAVYDILQTLRMGARIVPLTVETHDVGIRLAQRYQLSVYDGMIAAAALLSECDTLYSEDMHHGLTIEDRFRVVNPFRAP